jgi:hypothetical protein
MAEPRYTVKAFDASRWAAFAALVERRVVEPRDDAGGSLS